MTPVRAAQGLIDAVADADVRILDSAGHMMMIESPHESREALMSLIKRVAAG